ncbi:MAG: adenylate/guanylate cyclase domain-containing protein, partial [Solirubrobacteraceae bacterium]
MGSDEGQTNGAIQGPVDDSQDRLSRVRRAAVRLDSGTGLLAAARGLRRRLPGDERFGDPLSTAGDAPVQLIARSVSSLRPERESVVKELGLAGLQVWQSLSETAGRGAGKDELALLFTDLVGFSSWALDAGDAAVLELLREMGVVVEAAIVDHDGRIVKRLGDGLMATFLSVQDAVEAALDAQAALSRVSVDGYRELYPEVVDACEEEGGVPSRLMKTDRLKAGKEGTPCQMFAGSPSGRT